MDIAVISVGAGFLLIALVSIVFGFDCKTDNKLESILWFITAGILTVLGIYIILREVVL